MCISEEHSPIANDAKGNAEPDTNLRDNENVPLPSGATKWEHDVTARLETKPYRDSIDSYVKTEVLPYVPDAWVDHEKTKLGYEIPLTRHFYKYVPPRPLAEIDAEMKQLESEIQVLLNEVTE
jgi:type I restriction enzyme M protein